MNINCYVLERDDAMRERRKCERGKKVKEKELSRYKSSKFCPFSHSRIILTASKHFSLVRSMLKLQANLQFQASPGLAGVSSTLSAKFKQQLKVE